VCAILRRQAVVDETAVGVPKDDVRELIQYVIILVVLLDHHEINNEYSQDLIFDQTVRRKKSIQRCIHAHCEAHI
jgi:hypothetical protein